MQPRSYGAWWQGPVARSRRHRRGPGRRGARRRSRRTVRHRRSSRSVRSSSTGCRSRSRRGRSTRSGRTTRSCSSSARSIVLGVVGVAVGVLAIRGARGGAYALTATHRYSSGLGGPDPARADARQAAPDHRRHDRVDRRALVSGPTARAAASAPTAPPTDGRRSPAVPRRRDRHRFGRGAGRRHRSDPPAALRRRRRASGDRPPAGRHRVRPRFPPMRELPSTGCTRS